MTYELTCPWCEARLLLEDNRATRLVCPRCGAQVPNPATAIKTIAATSVSITAAAPKTKLVFPARAVPPRNVKTAWWVAYLATLMGTLLAIAGVIWAGFPGRKLIAAPPTATLNVGWVYLLNALNVLLTVLIIHPIGSALYHGKSAPASQHDANARTRVVIGILLVLTPIALFVVFFAVCSTAAVVMGLG